MLSLVLALALGAPAPGAARVASRFVEADGIRIHYRASGRGEVPLVFVHGWSCDARFWQGQIGALGAKGRVLAIDLPGHGRSAKPRTAYSLDLFVRAIAAVLDAEKAPRAVLVGHSNGAFSVYHYYRRHPERVAALVVVDGNLRPMIEPSRYRALAARFEGRGAGRAAERAIRPLLSPGLPPATRRFVRSAMLATPSHVRASSLRELADDGYWIERPIEVPLLALHAEAPYWTEEYEAFVRRLAPSCEYEVWRGVGHFLMLEQPERFNATLEEFLVRNGLLGGR